MPLSSHIFTKYRFDLFILNEDVLEHIYTGLEQEQEMSLANMMRAANADRL